MSKLNKSKRVKPNNRIGRGKFNGVGTDNSPVKHTPQQLDRWADRQRQAYREGKLTAGEIRMLNKVGFTWDDDNPEKVVDVSEGRSPTTKDSNTHVCASEPKSLLPVRKHSLTFEISTSDGDQIANHIVNCICTQHQADLIRRGIISETGGKALSHDERDKYFALTDLYRVRAMSDLGLCDEPCNWKLTHVDGEFFGD